MANSNILSIGDKAYYYDECGNIQSGSVTDIISYEKISGTRAIIKDAQGNTSVVRLEECSLTEQDCLRNGDTAATRASLNTDDELIGMAV